MQTAQQLYRDGKLNEAIQAVTQELKSSPADAQRRTFLFELLCFAGDFDRAERQLDSLAHEGPKAEMGALLYRAALHADRMRHDMFRNNTLPLQAAAGPVRGTLNGKPFESLEDADPRIGANLELLVAGSYTWIPLALLATVDMQPPKRLRDLLWAPVRVRPSSAYQGKELGEVFAPALSPGSCRHADDAVRLGRLTLWESSEGGGAVPFGQKMWLVDGEEFPLLELRRLEITPAPPAT